MSKVLITTETIAGSGHLKAAQGLLQGLAIVDGQIEAKVLTTLSYVSPALETLSRTAYTRTLNRAPKVWGWAYEKENVWSTLFKHGLGHILSIKIAELVKSEKPDVVLSTHAFCLSGFASVKKRLGHGFYLGAAITDFDVNGFWVHDDVDFYMVAHEDVKRKIMTRFGVAEEKIHVTGIPISPQFKRIEEDREQLKSKMGFKPDIPSVLVLGGGTGWGPIEEMLEALEAVPKHLQINVITGNNEELKNRLLGRVDESKHHIRIEGYVTNMAEWMAASDIAVTKPGGLTASEALACGLPLVIYQAIPGQEERNLRFLLNQNVAFRTETKEELSNAIASVLEDSQSLELLRQRILKLGKPESALHCANIISDIIKNNQHIDVGCLETV